MSEEEKLQALVTQMKMYESYLSDILARENSITRLMEEGRLGIEAIKNISEEEPLEMLMPIGMGIYVQTLSSPNKKLLVNIGAGVAIEKSKNEAVTYVETRLKEVEGAFRSMIVQKQEITTKMEQTRNEVNSILKKIQSPG